MRLGGSIFKDVKTPQEWITELRKYGYRTSACPIYTDVDDSVLMEFKAEAKKADIIIAEVGAWSNPLDPDENKRKAALLHCKKRLLVADKLGANCCANISGSFSPTNWSGPHEKNLTDEAFDMIVSITREIIDEVKPKNTFYTLEPMPWMYPDSVESYLKLIRAIDRKQFAVHFDPVNMINCPRVYYNNSLLLREFCKKLGKQIKSCHAKDIKLHDELGVQFKEEIPGAGILDYRTYLAEIEKLNPDMPLIIEHLPEESAYLKAIKYIRSIADELHIKI